MTTKKWITLFLCLSSMLLSSCGKVVQEAAEEEDTPLVKLTYSVSAPTQDTALIKASPDTPVYVSISGLKEKKRSLLSWGKGSISETKIPIDIQNPQSEMKTLRKSSAFNINGVEISKSQAKWAYTNYDDKKQKWTVTADKIKRKYPRYLVSAFSDKDTFYLDIIYDEVVSGNTTYDVGELSEYSTFLSILQLLQMETTISDTYNPDLSTLFDTTFFSLLSYTLPTNKTDSFSPKQPIFVFDRDLETHLLIILDLYQADPPEAALYVEQLNQETLPQKAKDYLLSVISGKSQT